MHPTHLPKGRWPDQPEAALFEDTYKLPAPETTDLARLDDVGVGGPIIVATGGPAGGGGGGASAVARLPRNIAEWLLQVLWRQKWLVLAVMVLGLIGAWVYMIAAT